MILQLFMSTSALKVFFLLYFDVILVSTDEEEDGEFENEEGLGLKAVYQEDLEDMSDEGDYEGEEGEEDEDDGVIEEEEEADGEADEDEDGEPGNKLL